MIPLSDENPTPIVPYVTITLIAINVLVFLLELYYMLTSQDVFVNFLYRYGAVPQILSSGQQLYSVFTSMFLHGDLAHIIGNMLFLWIFGDNIEYICGHFRFIIFYLLCGLIALFSHYIFDPMSTLPMVGASGAISGILGAYAIRFPRARVKVLWFFFLFIQISRIPAALVLGIWFFLQISSAMFSSAATGGVAWYAHIGGFIAGIALISKFEKKRYVVYYD